MKTTSFKSSFIRGLLFSILVASFIACDKPAPTPPKPDPTPNPEPKKEVTKLTVSPNKVTLDVGETVELKVEIEPQDVATPTFETSNAEVAVVEEGSLLKSVGEGDAVITVKAGDKTAMVIVSVKKRFVFKDPLSYFAEYNIKDLNKNWDKEHSVTGSGGTAFDQTYHFKWAEVAEVYNKPEGVEIDGKRWFIPTQEELLALFPIEDEEDKYLIQFNSYRVNKIPVTNVTIGGKDYKMQGASQGGSDFTSYASWTYTALDAEKASYYVIGKYIYEENKGLTIEMAVTDALHSIEEAKKAETWQGLTITKRFFPAMGYRDNEDNFIYVEGSQGAYWSSTEKNAVNNYTLDFGFNYCYVCATTKSYGLPLRLLLRE